MILRYDAPVGILDDGAQTARSRQKQSVLQEAQAAGTYVLGVDDVGDGGGAQVMASTMRALLGGRHRVDGVQIFRLQTNGWSHAYVQPYSGLQPLPGEHHAILSGSLPAPACLVRGGLLGEPQWESPDRALAQWLAGQPTLRAVTRELAWDWKSGMTVVRLPWTLQLRSVGDGTTHVVLAAGRYGGLLAYEVGCAAWLRACGALHPCLGPTPQAPQSFVQPTAYAQLLALADGPPAAQSVAAPVEYLESLRAALASHADKRVMLGNVPPAVESTVRQHVLPPAHAGAPLVVVIDLTTFGSCKDAIVVTPTHLVVKDGDRRVELPLAELQAVGEQSSFLASGVPVRTARHGDVSIALGIDPPPVLALLHAIAQANASAWR